MEQTERIHESIREWVVSQEVIDFRRQQWKSEVRKCITDTFEKIRKEAAGKMDFTVKHLDEYENMEAIVLFVEHQDSGIHHKDQGEASQMKKYGGELIYRQMLNGKIQAIEKYPQIPCVSETRESKAYTPREPKEVTEKVIIDDFSDFIEELRMWEEQAKDLEFDKIFTSSAAPRPQEV